MANVTLKTKIVLRNDTESNWLKANPVLIKVKWDIARTSSI